MKSMSISVILDWIPDKYRIFYKSTGLDQLFRHARMLDDSMEIIDNDFLYLTQESSFLDREWDIHKPRFLIFCTKTGSKEGQINPSWMEHAAILYTDEPFHKVFREFLRPPFFATRLPFFLQPESCCIIPGNFRKKSWELSGTRLSISALHRQNPYILTNTRELCRKFTAETA